MSYAAVLVHVQTDETGRARLKSATAVADMFDATLLGLGAEMVPPLSFDNGYVSADVEWYEAMSKGIEDGLAAARELFEAETKGLAKPADWRSGVEFPGPALSRGARRADLIVASAPGQGRPSTYRDAPAADLAITAGRPVLVTPAAAQPFSCERVVIAWKDTREARRAVSDALPFLQRAGSVLVLEVCAEAEEPDARAHVADVADLLKRHGARAETAVARCHQADSGEMILSRAAAYEADLIVAGAYGHSRLGEWVFGGVTRELLASSRHVLLSH